MCAVITPSGTQNAPKTKIYTIIGEPIALARPRFGKNKQVYDSQAQVKAGAGIQLRSQHRGELITTPIHMNVSFFFPCSDRHTHGKPHAQRPDLDNLIKYVSNGIIFKDDCLVVSIFAQKYYDLYVRTEFTITPCHEAKLLSF
jgi:Holliday junction resolvase RusA-like endonuclease